MYPTTTITTCLGTINLSITSKSNICASCSDATVNGVKIHFRLHLSTYNNKWEMLKTKDGRIEYHSLYAVRVDWKEARNHEATEAMRKKILKIIIPAVQKWAENNNKILIAAEQYEIQTKIDSKQKEYDELNNKMIEVAKEIEQLYEMKAKV